jgi:hypothetical protein
MPLCQWQIAKRQLDVLSRLELISDNSLCVGLFSRCVCVWVQRRLVIYGRPSASSRARVRFARPEAAPEKWEFMRRARNLSVLRRHFSSAA